MTSTTTTGGPYVRPWDDYSTSYVERVNYVERVLRLLDVLTSTVRPHRDAAAQAFTASTSKARADARRRATVERDSTTTARRARLAPYYVPPTAADVERAATVDVLDVERARRTVERGRRALLDVERPTNYGAVWTMADGASLYVERATALDRRRRTVERSTTGTVLSADAHRARGGDDTYWLARPWPNYSTSRTVRMSRPWPSSASTSYVLGRTAIGITPRERSADGTYRGGEPITAPAWRERTPRPLIPRTDHRDALDVERGSVDIERVYLLDGPTSVRRVERRAVRIDHQLLSEARAVERERRAVIERPLALTAAAAAVLDVERGTRVLAQVADGPRLYVERSTDGRITATLDGATAPYASCRRTTVKSVRNWLLDSTALVVGTRDRVLVKRATVRLDVDTDADGRLHY